MGLSSWSNKHRNDAVDWIFDKSNNNHNKAGDISKLQLGDRFIHRKPFMTGNPFNSKDDEDGFRVHWDNLKSLGDAKKLTLSEFDVYANLAKSIQSDLEDSAMALIASLKAQTGEKNIALVGGVALNSVLNGRVLQELGFDNVYVPPAPGDEGIAVGCAMYGLQVYVVHVYMNTFVCI